MCTKDIEKKILNYELEISNLNEFLEEDFKSTITALFNSLYCLLKHPKQNENLIDELFYTLDDLLKEETEEIKLNLIIKLVDVLNKKIEDTYNNKKKNEIAEYRVRLNKLSHNFKIKNEKLTVDNISSILRKLIYEEKDLDKLKTVLSSRKHIEYSCFKELFEEILENYVMLSDEEDINYYFKVIIIFIDSGFNKEIVKDASNYISILNKENNKKHVKLVEDRLNNKSISLDSLLKKYDVCYNNDLIYVPRIDYCECEYLRHDYTYQKVITIDEEGNKCNDDAFYIERNCDGTYTLYIHISDVPSLIERNSKLDWMAYKGAETKYLKDCEITTYPESVCNDLGSLLSGKERNVISYVFKLTPELEIDPHSFTIKRGIIKVDKALSYTDVDKRIKRKSLSEIDDMLKILDDVATILKEDNLHKEVYRSTENKTVDWETNSAKSSRSAAAKIVQELMILTNKHTAMYFSKGGYPYIYRVHEKPTEEIDKAILAVLGIDQKTLDSNPKCVKLVNAVKEKYLNAKYSETNIGHYGLGLEYYSHSTSPLRRYADAFGQYIMYDILFNSNFDDKTIYDWEEEVKEVCPYLNERIINNGLFASEYNYLKSRNRIRKR